MQEQTKIEFHHIILTVRALKKNKCGLCNGDSFYISFPHVCSKHFDTHDFSDRPKSHLILSPLSRNDDNNVSNNTFRKNAAKLPVRQLEAIILATLFTV